MVRLTLDRPLGGRGQECFLYGILGTAEETTRVTLFEAAMGPQIGGAIVAVQHGLNPPLVSLMVGLGISLSFLTLPLWSYALHHF